MLKNCKGVIAYKNQPLEEDIKSGIKNMFETIINNKPYTSAPADENKRKDFYEKISKGYIFLSDLITEQFAEDKIDFKQVYSCLESIGTSGKACAGRWKQVLEEIFEGFDKKIREKILSKVLEEKDFLDLNSTRVKIPENDINKVLEECVQERIFDFFVNIIEFMESNKVNLPNALNLDNKDGNTPFKMYPIG